MLLTDGSSKHAAIILEIKLKTRSRKPTAMKYSMEQVNVCCKQRGNNQFSRQATEVTMVIEPCDICYVEGQENEHLSMRPLCRSTAARGIVLRETMAVAIQTHLWHDHVTSIIPALCCNTVVSQVMLHHTCGTRSDN